MEDQLIAACSDGTPELGNTQHCDVPVPEPLTVYAAWTHAPARTVDQGGTQPRQGERANPPRRSEFRLRPSKTLADASPRRHQLGRHPAGHLHPRRHPASTTAAAQQPPPAIRRLGRRHHRRNVPRPADHHRQVTGISAAAKHSHLWGGTWSPTAARPPTPPGTFNVARVQHCPWSPPGSADDCHRPRTPHPGVTGKSLMRGDNVRPAKGSHLPRGARHESQVSPLGRPAGPGWVDSVIDTTPRRPLASGSTSRPPMLPARPVRSRRSPHPPPGPVRFSLVHHSNAWPADLYAKARARKCDHPQAVRILAPPGRPLSGVAGSRHRLHPAEHGGLHRIRNQDPETAGGLTRGN